MEWKYIQEKLSIPRKQTVVRAIEIETMKENIN